MWRSLFNHRKIDNYSLRKSRVEYGNWSEALAATRDTVWEELGTRVSFVVAAGLFNAFCDNYLAYFDAYDFIEILGDDWTELNYELLTSTTSL